MRARQPCLSLDSGSATDVFDVIRRSAVGPRLGRAEGWRRSRARKTFGWEVRLRFSRAVTYRLGTVVVAGALAILAFSQGTQWWNVVGAVLTGIAIADVIIVIAATWFRLRHRSES